MKKAAILISQSQQVSTDFRCLAGVDNDVADMHSVLQHAGYDPIQLVRDRSKAEVLATLNDVLAILAPGDRLLMYFSGHGHGINGQHVLICHGATLDQLEFFHEAIPVDQLRRMTDRRGLDRSLIADSCWDSPYVAGNRGGSPRLSDWEAQYLRNIGAAPAQPTAAGVQGSFSMLCGCSKDNVAVEVPVLRRGLFTAALVGVMKSAVRDGRELRLSTEVQVEVAQRMRMIAEEYHLPIVPEPLHSGSAAVILDGSATKKPAQQPSPVKNPTTNYARQELKVAGDGTGDFRTITEALTAASLGALIRVWPGVYREGLVIDKAIELLGEGSADWVVVENDKAPALACTARLATVRGMTLRCTAGAKGLEFGAVDVSDGSILIENCVITGGADTCVAIHGPDANPTLRRCKLQNGGVGVTVADHGKGTLEDCDIFAQMVAHIMVRTGGDPNLRRCKIHDGDIGVWVEQLGKGTLEDCDIFAQMVAHIMVRTGGDPNLRRCKIHDGQGSGVWVTELGKGTLEDCNIYGHAGLCVFVTDGGEPILRRCKIHDSPSNGVCVSDHGKGRLEDCDIFGHAETCVLVSTGGDPILHGCMIHDSASYGVHVNNQGKGTLEDCDIFGHNSSCVLVVSSGDPVLRRCKIHDSQQVLVIIMNEGRGTLEDCDIFRTASSGVRAALGGDPTLRRCKVHDCTLYGVSILDGCGTFEGCELWSNGRENFAIVTNRNVRRVDNVER